MEKARGSMAHTEMQMICMGFLEKPEVRCGYQTILPQSHVCNLVPLHYFNGLFLMSHWFD